MVLAAEEKKGPLSKKGLPFYDDDLVRKQPPPSQQADGVIEPYVRDVRLGAQGILSRVKNFNDSVSSKFLTAKSHSLGVVEFLQSEPELWQRALIVGVAGVTGFISGYRRSRYVQIRNTLLLGGAATTVCWPKQTVEFATQGFNFAKRPFDGLWDEYSPWSVKSIDRNSSSTASKEAEEDHGQANTEDKDMYSTRD